MKVNNIKTTGKSSNINITDDIFVDKVNEKLIAGAVRVYLSNLRQGTSKTQTRSDVTRTTRKWYQQKGTGNARHGAKTANLFVGGGVAHGPTGNQNWQKSFNSKMRRLALKHTLTAQSKNIVISKEVNDLSGKTKDGQAIIDQVREKKDMKGDKVLVILDSIKAKVNRSLRNIEKVKLVTSSNITALDVARVNKIIFTPEAVDSLAKRLNQSNNKKQSKKIKKKSKSK